MTTKKRQPKPRNAEKTRQKILVAAQKAFSERGYSQAGIREIASLAGISSPLLLRYFGSKAGLFEAALTDAVQIDALFQVDKHQFGHQLAKLLVNDSLELNPTSIVALATGNDDARAITTKVTEAQVLDPLADWLGPPNAHTRALEIMMLGMGFVLFTRQFPLLKEGKGTTSELVERFARSVQNIVDEGE